mmetsp:Transcript_35191/g.43029  ORF Transcript_35191/g.43029 Transcript_35191/m.43029 type:complete len:102 (+) Transcript_35191:35-340(+)
MLPEALKLICIELESMIELSSLSFRKNVLRNNPKAGEFAEELAKLVCSAQALIHLDISGMFMGDADVRHIMVQGVAESKTMAGVHFSDNYVTHWTRIQIYH